jgi:hypothetical protein
MDSEDKDFGLKLKAFRLLPLIEKTKTQLWLKASSL